MVQELRHQANLIRGVAKKVFSEMGSFCWESTNTNTFVDYKVGIMIEVPRSAFVADEVILMQPQYGAWTMGIPCPESGKR